MRLSLLVLGIIAATVCDENPAEAQIAKSIPVLAGITANKAPKALTDYAFRNGSGSLEVRCNPPRLIWENDVPMLDVRRARLVPIGRGSAD